MYCGGMGIRTIIGRWPSRKVMAADIGKTAATVNLWVHRGNIPAEFDVELMAAAKKRGVFLSYEELAKMRARQPT